ncbi:hypothetical protein BCEN4_140071 [Burkholderia cenocepacia]|nr:hypothetical protein BCEN4_140071 [Burkholderia cenocepacia]
MKKTAKAAKPSRVFCIQRPVDARSERHARPTLQSLRKQLSRRLPRARLSTYGLQGTHTVTQRRDNFRAYRAFN